MCLNLWCNISHYLLTECMFENNLQHITTTFVTNTVLQQINCVSLFLVRYRYIFFSIPKNSCYALYKMNQLVKITDLNAILREQFFLNIIFI